MSRDCADPCPHCGRQAAGLTFDTRPHSEKPGVRIRRKRCRHCQGQWRTAEVFLVLEPRIPVPTNAA